MNDFGKIFKKVRENRNFSQRKVANGILSPSLLSDFENGERDIKLVRFYHILEKIGVTFEEFIHIANDYEFSGFQRILHKVSDLYQSGNEIALKKLLLEETAKNKNEDIYHELNCLMIKVLISEIDKGFTLSQKEKDKITDYLVSIYDWAYYELLLYNNTMRVLGSPVIRQLSEAMLSFTKFYKEIPRNKNLMITIMLNTMIIFVDRKEVDDAIKFRQATEHLMAETDIFERAMFLYISGAIDFYRGKIDEGKKKMEDVIDIFEKVGSVNLARDYQQGYDEIINSAKET
ncbi:MAG: helix-turn-helix domain-containing protein [Defluviitaleaceae bacterium]|nr:helix-turn-helix domain-containing protein [Defluviitaleaceae bacterium]